jgi:hypothetical protein
MTEKKADAPQKARPSTLPRDALAANSIDEPRQVGLFAALSTVWLTQRSAKELDRTNK